MMFASPSKQPQTNHVHETLSPEAVQALDTLIAERVTHHLSHITTSYETRLQQFEHQLIQRYRDEQDTFVGTVAERIGTSRITTAQELKKDIRHYLGMQSTLFSLIIGVLLTLNVGLELWRVVAHHTPIPGHMTTSAGLKHPPLTPMHQPVGLSEKGTQGHLSETSTHPTKEADTPAKASSHATPASPSTHEHLTSLQEGLPPSSSTPHETPAAHHEHHETEAKHHETPEAQKASSSKHLKTIPVTEASHPTVHPTLKHVKTEVLYEGHSKHHH
jgi:hypothetical protein